MNWNIRAVCNSDYNFLLVDDFIKNFADTFPHWLAKIFFQITMRFTLTVMVCMDQIFQTFSISISSHHLLIHTRKNLAKGKQLN